MSNEGRQMRSAKLLERLRREIRSDDQGGTDLILEVIEEEGLYREFADDDGQQISSMAGFVQSLKSESALKPYIEE